MTAWTPRVLMITGAYYPEISASAVQCRDMARLLAGRAKIHVLTTAVDRALPADDRVDDVAVSRVFVDVRRLSSKLLAAGRMLAQLLRLVRSHDVVHLHGFSTKNVLVTAVARAFGRPVVLSLHTAGFDDATAVRQLGRAAWWAFANADLYLSVNSALMDGYLAAGLARDRIQLAPNGIDTRRFAPATLGERQTLRQSLGVDAERPVFLFVGFFSEDKQPRVLFEAWRRLQAEGVDSTLVFVGATKSAYFEVDDRLGEAMRDDAARLGLNERVLFAGPTHDVEHYFRAADVFVLPSRREGLPVALLEAMACALPCVASRLPGSTDTIVDNGRNGVLVPPGDVEAMTAALRAMVRDPVRAAQLGAAARETVIRRFANVDTAEHWLQAYHSLTPQGPGPRPQAPGQPQAQSPRPQARPQGPGPR